MMSPAYGLKKNKKSLHTIHLTTEELILRHVKFSEMASSNIMPLLSLNCLSQCKANLKVVSVKLSNRVYNAEVVFYFLSFCKKKNKKPTSLN